MLLFLNLNPVRKMTLAEFFATFDFLGIFLLMSGTGTLLTGFSIASDNGCGSQSYLDRHSEEVK
jgi:predicted membrane channel-forming protein YqfA (hemolysin III family)